MPWKIERGVEHEWVHFSHWSKRQLNDEIERFINEERPKSMSPIEDDPVPTFSRGQLNITYFFER